MPGGRTNEVCPRIFLGRSTRLGRIMLCDEMPKHVGNQNSNNKNCRDRLLSAHSENCHVGLLSSVCLLVVRCFGPAAPSPAAPGSNCPLCPLVTPLKPRAPRTSWRSISPTGARPRSAAHAGSVVLRSDGRGSTQNY